MSDRPSKARKLVGASVDDEGASNYGDMYGSADSEYLDLDIGAGIEGSAYLKETEGYKERTKLVKTRCRMNLKPALVGPAFTVSSWSM